MKSFYESYIGTSAKEREQMLSDIGKSDIMDLFSEIPSEILLKESLNIPGPMSEAELTKFFSRIAKKNVDPSTITSFLGGGVRQQYIPAALEELMRRGELYTAYTPYQPEVSQGMLQLLFEYQSQVAELLDMDIVNASMYDWGSAMGETIKIMHRISKKNKIIIAHPVSPNRIEVTKAYIKYTDIKLEFIEAKDGNVDTEKLLQRLEEESAKDKKEQEIAGVYFEYPNYYGTLVNQAEKICDAAHKLKNLVTVGVDPVAMAIFKTPGEFGADFVVGEGQMLGNSVNSGGPLLGILASKFERKWIRQVPGRLIGATTELQSNTPGYCITLQTREQHIRREKATSNICSNQAITAVIASIYLSALGRDGIVELAQSLMDRAHYLAKQLDALDKVHAPKHKNFFFSEFLVDFDGITHEDLDAKCIKKGFIAGKPIGIDGCTRLISVSEIQTKEDIDNFVRCIKEVLQ